MTWHRCFPAGGRVWWRRTFTCLPGRARARCYHWRLPWLGKGRRWMPHQERCS